MLHARPADEVPFADVQAVFGDRGDPHACQCQRFTIGRHEWTAPSQQQREQALHDDPAGLVAYDGDTPVGWCAVAPRSSYRALLTSRSPVVWKGRTEDPEDDGVWAVTCFVTRKGHRRQGISAFLAAAAVEHARARGARALEGYPMRTEPGKDVTWGELFVGAHSAFVDAGYAEVSHPTLRRHVMRIEL